MAAGMRLETLIHCTGPVGGVENPVIGPAIEYTSELDFTTNGYVRYIEDARNVCKFLQFVLDYFLDKVKSDFPLNPLTFIEKLNDEELEESVKKLKSVWENMYKELEKELKESLETQKEGFMKSPEEGSISFEKLPKLDPEAATGATSDEKKPVEKLEYPENIFMKKLTEFGDIVRTGYKKLIVKMEEKCLKALNTFREKKPTNLKEFVVKNIDELAKLKYYSRTLSHLVLELDSEFKYLRLNILRLQPFECRLTPWLSFEEFAAKRGHYMLLIPLQLSRRIAEISALAEQQIQNLKKISELLKQYLPKESEVFEEQMEKWKHYIRSQTPFRESLRSQLSKESDDTMNDPEEIPRD